MNTNPTIEANDVRRGHTFWPEPEVLAAIPAIGETGDTPTADKIVRLHFFGPSQDWFVVELGRDGEDEGLAYGWAEMFPGCGEWGYVYLPEIAEVFIPGKMLVPIERDCFWTPKPWSEVGRG